MTYTCSDCGAEVALAVVRLLLPKRGKPDDARPLCQTHQCEYPHERLYRPATAQSEGGGQV